MNFDILNITGILCFNKKYQILDNSNVRRFRFPKDDTYMLGFDPSKNLLGFYLTNLSRTVHYVLDIRNEHKVRLVMFMVEVEKLINYLLEGCNVKVVSIERHNMRNKFISQEALQQCRGMIENMVCDFEGMRDVKVGQVLPQEWRSQVLDKSKGKNRHKKDVVKMNITEDLIDKYPILEPYLMYCPKSFDGFEAMGILEGYLMLNQGSMGMRRVNKAMQVKANHDVYYWVNLVNSESFKLTSGLGSKIWVKERHSFSVLEYNEKLSFEENGRYATTIDSDVVCILIPIGYLYTWAMWKFDLIAAEDELLVAFFTRKKKGKGTSGLTQTEINIIAETERYGVF